MPKDFPIKADARCIYMVVSNSAEETHSLGVRIAGYLQKHGFHKKNCVISLVGELGSGKTCLAKGIAMGLNVVEKVTSPTYTIINEYGFFGNGSENKLYHIDAYRLSGSEDFEQIGGSEIINNNGISIIEWGNLILNSLPEDTITITIEITGTASRSINIKGIENL